MTISVAQMMQNYFNRYIDVTVNKMDNDFVAYRSQAFRAANSRKVLEADLEGMITLIREVGENKDNFNFDNHDSEYTKF